MNPNQDLWERGDFTRIAATMRESGEALVDSFGPLRGVSVLDVGCGDGTTAIPAAQRGADVLGVDISRPLVEAGNRRAQAAGLANLRFQHGDAANLRDLPDRHFDLVVSIFGAMFAPTPVDVAKALVRVTKRGGRIVMGNWIPDHPTFVAQLFRIGAAYAPPSPGFVSPMLWGVEHQVHDRFGAAGVPAANIACVRETFTYRASKSPVAYVDDFRQYFPPIVMAFAAAEADGRVESLRRELTTLFEEQNTSATPGMTSLPATFLRVTVAV